MTKTRHMIRGHRVEVVYHEGSGTADVVAYTTTGEISALTAYDVPVADLKKTLRETGTIMRALPEQAEAALPDEKLLAYVRCTLGLKGYTARALAQILATGAKGKTHTV